MTYSIKKLIFVVPFTVFLLAACTKTAPSSNWQFIERLSPLSQNMAITLGSEAGRFFFQCDDKHLLAGLRLPEMMYSEGSEKTVSLYFDKEPVYELKWTIVEGDLTIAGDEAAVLAGKAALAFNLEVNVDGRVGDFSLTGSHAALIDMSEKCPFLAVT